MAIDERTLKNYKNDKIVKTSNTNTWYLVAEGGWLAGQQFAVNGHAVLGRESGCEITIPGTHLSRRHAELAVNGSTLQMRDLGSANGTYVNGTRVTTAELLAGDRVQFDVLHFRVIGPSSTSPVSKKTNSRCTTAAINTEATPSITSTAEKLWKTKPTSVGNREQTLHPSMVQKAVHSIWTSVVIVIGLITLAAVGYLITQL